MDRVRRLAATRQAGFSGTLDPLATGVLVCALGGATRLLTYLEGDEKRYQATVELGRETDTDDAEGHEVATGDWSGVSRAAVEKALTAFRGPIRQRPPAFSAISVGGKRLYTLARRGEAVVVPERDVTIFSLVLTAWQPPRLSLEIHCSKGTYIRALARDLGRALGCSAYLAALRRTASGRFNLAQAISLDQLEQAAPHLGRYLLPPEAGVAHLPALVVDAGDAERIRRGQRIRRPPAEAGLIALFDPAHHLLAIGRTAGDEIQPEKVFPGPAPTTG